MKKNSLNDDIVQIGWVGQGLKSHFFPNRNMDIGKVRVGQNPICPCSKKLLYYERKGSQNPSHYQFWLFFGLFCQFLWSYIDLTLNGA